MRSLVRSAPLLATLGAACFQDGGHLDTAGSSGVATTTGADPTDSGSSSSSSSTTGWPANSPCEAHYWTDFTADPGADWTVFSPSWLWDMVSGSYQGKTINQVGAGAQLEVGKWQDFTLHVRLRLGPTSYGGVVLRAADQFQGDFLYIQLDSTDGDLEGFRANQTDADFGFTGLVTANAWQDLVVHFQGTDLSITLDGAQLATGLQVQGLTMGGIGLIVLQGSIDIDAIAVCPP